MEKLLATLRDRQVQIFRHGDRLVLHGATTAVDASLRNALLTAKSALLSELADGGLFEMNVCQRSMVLDELFRYNLTGNSIFLPLDHARDHDPAVMRQFADDLHRRFPLLGAAAELDGERFCFRISGVPAPRLVEDPRPHGGIGDFVEDWTHRAHSMFDAPLAQVVSGIAAGRRCWGLWMHHAVADAPFIDHIVSLLRGVLQRGERFEGAPDFNFLQQNALIARQTAAAAGRSESYWRACASSLGRQATRDTVPIPTAETVSTVEWTLPKASTERLARALRATQASSLALYSVALGVALDAAGWGGNRVALTTFSMRHLVPGPACSGFYTTLMPFGLAAPAPGSSSTAAVRDAAVALRAGFDHALMPPERISELASIDPHAVVAILNLLRVDDDPTPAPPTGLPDAPLFLAGSGDKLRRPLKLTLIESPQGPRGAIFSARLSPDHLRQVAGAMRAFVAAFEEAAP